jgi:hypothetical protein
VASGRADVVDRRDDGTAELAGDGNDVPPPIARDRVRSAWGGTVARLLSSEDPVFGISCASRAARLAPATGSSSQQSSRC